MEIKKNVSITVEDSNGKKLEEGTAVIFITKDDIESCGVFQGIGERGYVKISGIINEEVKNYKPSSIKAIYPAYIQLGDEDEE